MGRPLNASYWWWLVGLSLPWVCHVYLVMPEGFEVSHAAVKAGGRGSGFMKEPLVVAHCSTLVPCPQPFSHLQQYPLLMPQACRKDR